MKTNDQNRQNVNIKQPQQKNNRPENKDNLDSRKNEEQDLKGDDITHNEKETKEERRKH